MCIVHKTLLLYHSLYAYIYMCIVHKTLLSRFDDHSTESIVDGVFTYKALCEYPTHTLRLVPQECEYLIIVYMHMHIYIYMCIACKTF